MTTRSAHPRPSKPRKPQTVRLATPFALALSLIVHLAIFLFVGSVVIFEGKIPPNLFQASGSPAVQEYGSMEVPPLIEEVVLPEPLDSPLDDPSIDLLENTSEPAASDVIVSKTVDSHHASSSLRSFITTQKIDIPKNTPQTELNRQQDSPARKGPGVPRTANIFGRVVEATRFGAILDISSSTHQTIDVAVREITSGFPDALLVLASGCGMTEKSKGEVIDGETYERELDKYGMEGLFSSAFFLEKLLGRNKKFQDFWDDAMREGRGYVLHVPFDPDDIEEQVEEKKEQIEEEIGDLKKAAVYEIRSTQHAFAFLESQECDTIYWMADFADGVQQHVVEDLAKDLKRSDIKVIQHDFDGGDELNDKRKSYLWRETGGEKIVGSGSAK